MSLLQSLRSLFLPKTRKTSAFSLGEPPAVASTLSAARLHGILRQAEAGDTQDLFSVYREMILGHAHTQTVFNQRKLAALADALTILPADQDNPDDVAAAKACKALTNSPGWLTSAMNHLLNGHLYPVAVLEVVYGSAPYGSGLRFVPVQWNPVPYHLLDYGLGKLMLWDAEPTTGHRLGSRSSIDPRRHIVHRGHLLTNIPDNWGGPLRAALFWYLFAQMDRDWWVRFLDRFGAPFIVGKYEDGRDADRRLLTTAFAAATKLFGLVVTRETDIQVHSVTTSSHGEAFEKMQAFANAELSKLILGQTMTVTAQASGLGSNQAQVQDNVRGDIKAWDITALAETVRLQIINPFLEVNGLPGRAELSVVTSNAAEIETQTKVLTAATQAGLKLTPAGVTLFSKSTGLPFEAGPAPAAPLPGQRLPLTTLFDGPLALRTDSIADAQARRLRQLGQPTNDDLDRIATAGAPSLARAFRGRYLPLAKMIEDAPDQATLEAQLLDYTSALPPAKAATLIEDALSAYSATAAATARFS